MPSESLTPDAANDIMEVLMDDFDDAAADTKWRRGQSGNPHGRPPAPDDLDDLLVYALGKTKARFLVDELINLALNGDGHVKMRAIEYIFDRIKGKPRQSIEPLSADEPVFLAVLRKLVDDKTALEGRTLPPTIQ